MEVVTLSGPLEWSSSCSSGGQFSGEGELAMLQR